MYRLQYQFNTFYCNSVLFGNMFYIYIQLSHILTASASYMHTTTVTYTQLCL